MKYKIVKKLKKSHIKTLYKLYKKEWWSADRELKDIKKMVKNSDITVGILNKKGNLIAFTRVLSDFTYKAEIYDVIVKKRYRKRGVGRKLIEEILNHKKLKNVEQFNLQCREDMAKFYKKFDFKEVENLIYMRRNK